jgi:hypothetical protein
VIFPEKIAYKDLQVNHPEYNPEILDKYDALYCGGKKFRDGIEKFNFLDKRQLDGYGSEARPQSSKMDPEQAIKAAARFQGLTSRWEEKKKVGRYINYIAGLLDYFVQAIFTDEPSIVAPGDYWTNFCNNANGNGNTLSTISRRMMLGSLKDFRSYLSLKVATVTPTATSKGEQRQQGGFNVVWDSLGAKDVNHWLEDKGKLIWVRTYRKDQMQVNVFGPPTKIRELWTYITDTDLIEYQVVYDASNPPKPEDMIDRQPVKKHGFPRIPVIPVRINCDLWAMERLEDPALALYNRETAITVLINSAAFQILTVATSEQPDNVPDTTMGALWVGPNGKAEMIGPQGNAFEPQFKDRENKRRAMAEVFNSIGVNILATQTQNARQSADAKEEDKEPMMAALVTFANGLLETLRQGAQLTADFREDKSKPEVTGLKTFDISALKEKIARLLEVQDVQGFPETAHRLMLKDTAIACVPSATADEKAIIRKEAESAELEPPAPAPINQDPMAVVKPEVIKAGD